MTKQKEYTKKSKQFIEILEREFGLTAGVTHESMFGSLVTQILDSQKDGRGRLFLVESVGALSIVDLKNGVGQSLSTSPTSKPRIIFSSRSRASASFAYQNTDQSLWPGISSSVHQFSGSVNSYERKAFLSEVLACIMRGYDRKDHTWDPLFPEDHVDVSSKKFFDNQKHCYAESSGIRWIVTKPRDKAYLSDPGVKLCFSKSNLGDTSKTTFHLSFNTNANSRTNCVFVEKATER